MKKSILPFAAFAFAAFALASCGSSGETSTSGTGSSTPAPTSSPTTEPVAQGIARPFKSAILGEFREEKLMGVVDVQVYTSHFVNLFENATYEYTNITAIYQKSTGGVVSLSGITLYGTFVDEGVEDGVTTIALNKAAEVVISNDIIMGGSQVSVNTAADYQTYPVELPAQTQGEKNMANNKQEVLDKVGTGIKVFVDENNVIAFTNDEHPEPVAVNTPSGAINANAVGNFKAVRITGEKSENPYGGNNYKVHYLHIFKDNYYRYFTAEFSYGYSMLLGTTNIVSYGQGAYGTSEDGVSPFTLSKAEDVVLNMKSVQASLAINTASANQTYPTELPARQQGEQRMANNKDEVLEDCCPGRTLYLSDTGVDMSLTQE